MQIERMFEIVYILLEKQKVTAAYLAERFGVSSRTIYRDIDALSSAGIPIYSVRGTGGGIQLLDGFVLNKALLTESEKRETLTSLAALCAADGKGSDALKKLSSFFGEERSDWIEIDFGGWYPRNRANSRIELFKTAILERRAVEIVYASAKSEERRLIEPVKLVFLSMNWYIMAWCRLRNDYRWFKLMRITDAELTCERFEPRENPPPCHRDAPNDERETVQLLVSVSHDMEYRLRDEFSPDSIVKNPDGSFDVSFSMPEDDWLYQYLLSYGEKLRVISPERIADSLKERLKKACEQYL